MIRKGRKAFAERLRIDFPVGARYHTLPETGKLKCLVAFQHEPNNREDDQQQVTS
jgi:hypothetical protein